MIWALAVVSALAAVPAGLRWLRIAQREHYLPFSTSRFAWRWWTTGPTNSVLVLLGVVGVLGSLWSVWFGFLVAAAQVGPIGLSVTGVTSPLAWTDRMKRLTMVTAALFVLLCVVGVVADVPLLIALGLLSLPVLVDIALAILAPVERSIASKWVAKARAKLESVGPDVVAITGSYGKTTTKNYVEHLLMGSRRTVASPASFNNRMGLARAINEGLTAGTEVFIAEMGTYGPGEIAELCEWITPRIAAMVAVGPVHLERFGTLERIVRAKAEILEHAEVGVINIADPLLAPLAQSKIETMQIIEVEAWHGRLKVDGSDLGAVPDGAFGSNLAVAVGICLSLGVDRDVVLDRMSNLPIAKHRQSIARSEAGFDIIDDTFNSNPEGARVALGKLRVLGQGRKVVVTPGMVEMGSMQVSENTTFARLAADVADHLVIVGHTNRRALLEGSSNGSASVTVLDSREDAVVWVRANLGPGDAVLYENDLPDHYP